jgi:hypothetical protein
MAEMLTAYMSDPESQSSGASSSESGTTTTDDLMSDSSSSSIVRIPLKSQNQQVDNRSQAEIISQQAFDVQNHHQWNQHPEVIEELHRTWREAIKVAEQQAQEQRAIEAVAK